jgi:hypothetical protein
MSTFILWSVIFAAVNIVASAIVLANGVKVTRTPGSIALGVVTSSTWAAWGIYLLSKAAA